MQIMNGMFVGLSAGRHDFFLQFYVLTKQSLNKNPLVRIYKFMSLKQYSACIIWVWH